MRKITWTVCLMGDGRIAYADDAGSADVGEPGGAGSGVSMVRS